MTTVQNGVAVITCDGRELRRFKVYATLVYPNGVPPVYLTREEFDTWPTAARDRWLSGNDGRCIAMESES